MASNLPDYVASAKPVPKANRMPWYTSTAQTYAGIMLWFVFWQEIPVGDGIPGTQFSKFAGGTLSQGVGVALVGLVLAALLCHFLFYVVPGMFGMKTGLPLYIVGTSTYGAVGGFLMPGFLMGLLQYGWLAVNSYFSAELLCAPFGYEPGMLVHSLVASGWAIAAAFMGVKGIQYVAKVATFFPIIPLAILLILFFSTVGGVGTFDTQAAIDAGTTVDIMEKGEVVDTVTTENPLSSWGVIALLCTCIIGFFATAGAAGCDFGMNNRDAKDVQLGGLIGIAGATIFAGGLALLIIAGTYGSGIVEYGPTLKPPALMGKIVTGEILGFKVSEVFMWLLAIAAFPPACFSSFIAANSFKTTLPKVPPLISCGAGTLIAIALAVSGYAGNAVGVFKIIGASFGPVCGAMAADYLLAGRKWPGPRAGFNLAGWISWVLGFIVGAADFIPGMAGIVPIPPLSAFFVGFGVYFVLAKLGLEGKTLEMPNLEQETPEPEPSS